MIGGLKRPDRLIDGIPAAPCFLGNRFIAREAKPALAVVEAPQQGLKHLDIGAGKRASMLARLSVVGGPRARIDHDAGLGVAVERDPACGTEHLFTAWPQMIRQVGSLRHGFSVRVAASNPPEGAGKSAQNRSLAKTGFSLDGRLDLGESRNCKVHEILPASAGKCSPAFERGFCFLGVGFSRMLTTRLGRLARVIA
jgi:hypothetical protein